MTMLDETRDADGVVGVWVDVCRLEDLVPDRGACALVAGRPVAVFRVSPDDTIYAIGNIDPYSGSSVLSRGIVGSVGDRTVVASPLFKQRFDLATGTAVEDASVSAGSYATRCHNGVVQVTVAPGAT